MSALSNKGSRSRKARAILAGGIVLGVGAAVTLAAWNDSEFVTGTFNAGHFSVQGSTDGTAFSDHVSGSPATLSFSTGFDKLSPSTTVAAPYVLHLDKDTVYDATVSVNSAASSGTAASQLTYGIVEVASVADCTPSAVGVSTIVPAGTALNSVDGATPFGLTKPVTPGTSPGSDQFLCLQVTAGAGLVQGSSAVGTWEFRATSTS
ncbi:SipW-dependent-type signal peptide-containing protein [Arthrobacter sp. YA7-1]|uniref:SipW-dependent-type signal peptide-containing protein n=1 Tax=Arthrobacter sp. YA7-1 TaxID=2987701 RepID=UPI002226990C|nr:SipW-dependent-type signal peptide-containing protein [Arthrobacter sp. YA7-1]UYY81987.1 SipW-dependent-type signal peptide-containing protein [Arthrobacter sp. YA7-1]